MGKRVAITLRVDLARRPDGLIVAARVTAPKIVNVLYWLNRETGTLEELRLYRVGMAGGRR